jgi:TolA-binding protein
VAFHLRNPERIYTHAWELYRAGETAKAASHFDEAYLARSSAAKKEEALFWSAKTHELSQQTQAAMDRYRALTANYTGYWVPESLFTLAHLSERNGDLAMAQNLRQRLRTEFPNNEWTRKLTPAAR